MVHNLPQLVSNKRRPGTAIRAELRRPLTDKPMLSAIGAAMTLLVALELIPGIDHAATAMGLTAALVLIGASVTPGLLLRERARRKSKGFFAKPLSLGFVGTVTIVGFVYCLVPAVIVLSFRSFWIADGAIASAGLILGASFASALGAMLGMTVGHRGALNAWSLLLFCALLVPVSLCGADDLPATARVAFSAVPTVALAEILRASLSGNAAANRLAIDAALLIASTVLLLLVAAQRTLAGRSCR